MLTSERKCGCGCGEIVKKRFIPGHNKRTGYCQRGLHPLIPENVYVHKGNGKRHCRPCKLEWQRARRKEKPDVYWQTTTRHRYKLTADDCLKIWQSQNGKCAVCLIPIEPRGNFNTIIDHCHQSKSVRGLLCRKCNTALGMLADSSENARRAAEYLERHRTLSAA